MVYHMWHKTVAAATAVGRDRQGQPTAATTPSACCCALLLCYLLA